jgi:Fic-DOC domain mobile mystery protein B
MQFFYPEGATPYNYDDVANLIPKHITLQRELDEWEQRNISLAEAWAFKAKKNNILQLSFTKQLHKKMFDRTWKWAGNLRTYQTNIGCRPEEIINKLLHLLSDISYYIENDIYSLLEISVRLHHGLVFIHPFPNGNGRHARLLTDLFLVNNGHKRLSWGSENLVNSGSMRSKYIKALKAADQHDFEALIKFVVS